MAAPLLLLLLSIALLLGGCATPHAPAAIEGDDLIIVALAERPSSLPAVGGSARGDYRRLSYFGSDEVQAVAQDIAREQRLLEVASWTIQPLALRCMLYRLAPGADRAAIIAALQRDPRVALAQASQTFDTLAVTESPRWNDPLLAQQHGLQGIGALSAQQWGLGEDVTVAVIDGAVDVSHPDLAGRIKGQRDFVRGPLEGPGIDRHGTAVAGVIAATANNGLGIVGVAPRANLLALRACWAVGGAGAARCSSFTLAQSLVAAVTAGVDVINLSLGGPRDALLEQLVAYATSRGVIVVGALPASRRIEGFPAAVPGVLVAATAEDQAPVRGTLAAPGRRILTLSPGGGYALHDGSSMAAAHVSGAMALLKSIRRELSVNDALRLLTAEAAAPLALCVAARTLVGAGAQSAAAQAGPAAC